MSEEETRAKGQRPRIAKLSVLSLILSVVGFLLSTIVAYVVARFTGALTWGWVISFIIVFAALVVSILSIIIGKIGLKEIVKSNGLLSGHKFVYTGQLIAIITIIYIGLVLFTLLSFMLRGIGPNR